jgi:hypothetical protein
VRSPTPGNIVTKKKQVPERCESDEPRRGQAARGKPISPVDLSDEPTSSVDEPKSAPAPGAPLDAEEVRRLKDQARRRRAPRDAIAQEDKPKRSKP